MIIITGGCGFIGSCLQARLWHLGYETIIIDWLSEKWRNLAAHPPEKIIFPEEIDIFLSQINPQTIEAIFHLGAISDTTADDGNLVWNTNVVLSQKLWHWCTRHKIAFIYASSAATYGDAHGQDGFKDELNAIKNLKPTNLYGWSKQVFDLWVKKQVQDIQKMPPQWIGLKFFNVYGPNEYHKGKMISVIKVKFDEIMTGKAASLFKSTIPTLEDGQQKRDFVWVGDVVDVMIWALKHPNICGLFNCGTGRATSYHDLVHFIYKALNKKVAINFIDMPQKLKAHYQSFTQADMTKLRQAGYNKAFTPLEEGIKTYIQDYLMNKESYI